MSRADLPSGSGGSGGPVVVGPQASEAEQRQQRQDDGHAPRQHRPGEQPLGRYRATSAAELEDQRVGAALAADLDLLDALEGVSHDRLGPGAPNQHAPLQREPTAHQHRPNPVGGRGQGRRVARLEVPLPWRRHASSEAEAIARPPSACEREQGQRCAPRTSTIVERSPRLGQGWVLDRLVRRAERRGNAAGRRGADSGP